MTNNVADAVRDADFVVCAREKDRNIYWSQDFHIPRKYGFKQVYGENGGVGSMFHALRNIKPIKRPRKLVPVSDGNIVDSEDEDDNSDQGMNTGE